ncbi:unnamed protein product [Urochloa humidicola]
MVAVVHAGRAAAQWGEVSCELRQPVRRGELSTNKGFYFSYRHWDGVQLKCTFRDVSNCLDHLGIFFSHEDDAIIRQYL